MAEMAAMSSAMADPSLLQVPGPSTSKDLNTIPEGRVGKVCKEWLVREDSNLAYQLQHEEISKHYSDNRVKNRTVRDDIPVAKELQEKEFQEIQRKRYVQLMEEISQEDLDARVARQMQQVILDEEAEKKRATEEADQRYALKLLEKEKARQRRKRLERERQQVAEVSAQIGIVQYPTIKPSTSQQLSGRDRRLSSVSNASIMLNRPESYQRVLMEDEHELDMSEFCAPPPPGLTPEELRVFIEEQDSEIARLVQSQDSKRKMNSQRHRQASIEEQDFKLALALQKIEKERLKRIKEKVRARQALVKEGDGQSMVSENVFDLSDPSIANRDYQRTSTPISPEATFNEENFQQENQENLYDIPENHRHDDQRPSSSADSITYEVPYELVPGPSNNSSSMSPFRQAFHNIAMDLDPTYQRRMIEKNRSSSNLIESCVDDDRLSFVGSGGSGGEFQSRFARSTDSLDKIKRANGHNQSRSHQGTPIEFLAHTSPSGSSRSSSSSRRSNQSQRSNLSTDPNDPNYAPPLPPPRDMSLIPRQRQTEVVSSTSGGGGGSGSPHTFLPPHHPQHPNANRNVEFPLPGKYSPNSRQSGFYQPTSTSPTNSSSTTMPPIIQGQRRVSSIEKPKTKDGSKQKQQPDTCITQ